MRSSLSHHGLLTLGVASLSGLLWSSTAHAAEIRISPGDDFVDAMRSASPGDVVLLAPGSYEGGRWIDVQGREGAPITVRGEGALGDAVIEGGGETLRIGDGGAYLVFENLEIRNGGDNLIHIDGNAHDIVFRDVRAHDAGPNGDVIKVNQSARITLERVETWGAGRRDGDDIPYQECIDFVDVDDVLVRDSYLHDCGDLLMYAKGGSRRVVFERNVFDCGGQSFTQPGVGLGAVTDADLIDGDFEGYEMVARNNLFLRCGSGGLAVYDVQGAWIVHNLFLDVSGPIVQIREGNAPAGHSEDVHVANNLIVSTGGGLDDLYQVQSSEVRGFETRGNAYWNGGSGLPGGGLADPNAEVGAVVGDPAIGSCSGSTWAEIVGSCAPTSMAVLDRGTDLAGTPGDTRDDIRGGPRPLGSAADQGPYEGPGDPPPPTPTPTPTPTPPTPPGTDAGVVPPPGTDAGRDGGRGGSGDDDGGCSVGASSSSSRAAEALTWLAIALGAILVERRARRPR